MNICMLSCRSDLFLNKKKINTFSDYRVVTKNYVTTVSPSACFYDLENIGSVYPAMSMIVIGHSLLY